MIKVLGIDHAAINVSDLGRAMEFYTKVLGLKVTRREPSKLGVEYFLDCGASLMGLIQGKPEEGEHFLNDSGLGGNHISFRIRKADFDRAVDELKKHNVQILFSKKREKSWSVYFLDPDGNKLELTTWPLERD